MSWLYVLLRSQIKGIVDLAAKVANGAFQFGVPYS